MRSLTRRRRWSQRSTHTSVVAHLAVRDLYYESAARLLDERRSSASRSVHRGVSLNEDLAISLCVVDLEVAPVHHQRPFPARDRHPVLAEQVVSSHVFTNTTF